MIKKVAVFGQTYSVNAEKEISILLTALEKHNVVVFFEENFYNVIKDLGHLTKRYPTFASFHDLNSSFDLFFSLGGDGTILRAITYIRDLNIPILGINTGRLGFLANIQKNAIEESSLFVNEIKAKLESGQENKTKGMMLTATITEIKGGLSHNVTPRECDSTLDIRIPVGTSCKSVEEKISEVVKEISKKQQVEAFYSIIDETEPFEAEHNSPLVRALTLGILDIEKNRPTLIRKTGTGDMNVIGNKLSIPVVTYGPGDPHAAHTIDEKISIDEYLRGIEVLKRTIQHLKRLHDKIK